MIDPDFLEQFQAARSQALRKRMENTPALLRRSFDEANQREAQQFAIRLWIALFAMVVSGAFYR